MTPVDQTTFGFPGGNCFSACVAALLEIPLEEVPYFMDPIEGWYDRFSEWLAKRSIYPMCFKLSESPMEWSKAWTPVGFHILSGRSPRHATWLHSVVALGHTIMHDPHPSRAGLTTRDDVIILIPMDPAHVGRTVHS